MGEKVKKAGIRRHKDYMYYVKGGDIWRSKRGVKGSGKVYKRLGLRPDLKSFIYYVDSAGDVSRSARGRSKGSSAKSKKSSTSSKGKSKASKNKSVTSSSMPRGTSSKARKPTSNSKKSSSKSKSSTGSTRTTRGSTVSRAKAALKATGRGKLSDVGLFNLDF